MTYNEITHALNRLHTKILAGDFSKVVSESEMLALVEAQRIIYNQGKLIERLQEKYDRTAYNLRAVLEERLEED